MSKVVDLHRVTDSDLLRDLMLFLKRKYTIVSVQEMEEAINGGANTGGLCHITIDDGDLSSYEVIYPLVVQLKIPVTLFVTPGICLEGRNFWFQEVENFDPVRLHDLVCEMAGLDETKFGSFPATVLMKSLAIDQIDEVVKIYRTKYGTPSTGRRNINGDQIIEMDRSGWVTMGAHTMNHPILANETLEKSQWEITQSLRSMEELLGHPVPYFAYPNGLPGLDFGNREMDIVRESGCSMAFSNHLGSYHKGSDRYMVPRYALEIPFFSSGRGNLAMARVKMSLGPNWDRLKLFFKPDEGAVRMQLKEKLAASDVSSS